MSARKEMARWGQLADVTLRKFVQEAQTLADQMAARGRMQPSTVMQDALVGMSQEVRRLLTKGNVEIYQDTLSDAAKVEDVEQKVFLGLKAAELKEYKAMLENQDKLNRADAELDLDKRKADLAMLESQIKARQAAIIMEQAKLEAEINYWRRLEVEAERISLGKELELIQAKVETAALQASIIPYLKAVIDSEYQIVDAEQRRAAILPYLIEAKQKVAETKETMIPLYEEKAEARIAQAEAVRQEAEWRRALEELGYRKLELREAEEDAKHEIRLQEVIYNQTHLEYIRADRYLALIKQQADTALTEYRAAIKRELIERGKVLELDEKQFRLELTHFFRGLELMHQLMALELENLLYNKELAAKLNRIAQEARNDCETIRDNAWRKQRYFKAHRQHHYISKGS